ncbi:DUF4129 domain-containing protein [Candidatus Formimonas warabiya]|uniref:Protein-glutamine gamma-glutamyltransferase-like C-terminal domain-containing protein n=1 Tax=Formimonas warabiya TaxID=1761012 RepID=A0A3G1KT89_FORW1|nr:DUF4129 domain-containing protein [Candidatus Formimonas warabiya]ATW25375.1 hypothetical protein DCMF_11880 [Candidatus Formimonas warabiya]
MSNPWVSADPAVVHEKAKVLLAEILKRPEFHQGDRFPWFSAWKEKLDQWLSERLSFIFHSRGFSRLWDLVAGLDYLALFILLVLAVVFLGYFLFRGGKLMHWSGAPSLRADLVPAPSSSELHQEAKAAAAAGNWERAVRVNFRAVLVRLGEQRTIHYRPGKTDWECLEEFKRECPQKFFYLERLVALFERKWYGSISFSPHDYEESEALLRELWEGRSSLG